MTESEQGPQENASRRSEEIGDDRHSTSAQTLAAGDGDEFRLKHSVTLSDLLRVVGSRLVSCSILGAILFVAAGRLDLVWFWISIIGIFVVSVVGRMSMDSELRQIRQRRAVGDDRKLPRLAVPLYFLGCVVAGLDVGRFHWSGHVNEALQLVSVVFFLAMLAFGFWARHVNQFAVRYIRLQPERGQIVICTGPYRIVRHPMYSAAIICSVTFGLALGSWWALVPMTIAAAMFVVRTAREDRLLHAELNGYREYATRVRYRVLAGIW